MELITLKDMYLTADIISLIPHTAKLLKLQ